MKLNIKNIELTPVLIFVYIFIVLIFSSLFIFLLYTVYLNNYVIPFSCSMILLLGLVIEFKRICNSWIKVLLTAMFAVFGGLIRLIFYPILEIMSLPIGICIAFGIATFEFYGYKTRISLTEGITFIQSLAIIYWLTENISSIRFNNIYYFIAGILFLFSLFSTFHAFSYFKLKRSYRFLSSLWSAFIMTFFALLNVYSLFKMQKNINEISFMILLLQYFLLGISSVYIIQNIYLIIGYLPNKLDWKYGFRYYKRQRLKLTNIHILRFSDTQVNKRSSLICFIFCITIFSLNYFIKLLPPNLVIWLSFFLIPILINILDKFLLEKPFNL